MKKLLFIVIFLSISFMGWSQTDKRLKGVEKDLTDILEGTNAPGFAVAVVEKDQIVYAEGFGYRDVENKIPVDANTVFAIGSSTKAFTSAILGQLREEGKLSFDDSPRKYLPELSFYNDDLNNQIIIKDLMRHTTGIPRHDFSWYLFPTYSSDTLLRRIKYQKPFTGLRQQWYYNNFMFLTQGEIGHKLTGKSWGENIKERFFEPLGMERSSVSIAELLEEENRAIGYGTKKDGTNEETDYYHIAGMRAAGSINSSVNEMSKWAITWINGGQYKDTQILPKRYVQEAMKPSAVVGGGMSARLMMLMDNPQLHAVNYGYGWFITDYRGNYQVEHGGNIDGFSASVAFYPEKEVGIIVLTNQNGSIVPNLVRNTMADRMLNLSAKNWLERYLEIKKKTEKAQEAAQASEDANQIKNTKPSHNLIEFAGNYASDGYGEFDIVLEKDSLFAQFKLMKLWLKHYHYDVFVPFVVEDGKVITEAPFPFKFNFSTNLSGDIASADIKIEPAISTPIKFKHTPNTLSLTDKDLEVYIGDYELGGMTINVHLKDGTLYAFVPGQTDYELLPLEKHLFALKNLEGYKVSFLKDEQGTINAVNFIQPNGTFKAEKK